MDKRIAVPTSNDMLDEHFGHCKKFTIIDIEEGKVINTIALDAPPHQPGLLPPWLAERGVTDVIAGGMGQRAIQIFNQHGVNVFVGAPRLSPYELVEGFMNGSLVFNANYCDH
jgi:predicted Fe-Mo cluster-binding NifX family protein